MLFVILIIKFYDILQYIVCDLPIFYNIHTVGEGELSSFYLHNANQHVGAFPPFLELVSP
jgi:hypothetical protein